MESFKQSISKRFESQDEKFHTIEVNQSECKKRLRNLEEAKARSDENEEIESQNVKNILIGIIFCNIGLVLKCIKIHEGTIKARKNVSYQ